MGTSRRTLAVLLTGLLLVTACTGGRTEAGIRRPAPPAGTVTVASNGSATATDGPWTVTLPAGAAPAGATVSIRAATGAPPASLDAGPGVKRVGTPVELTLSSGQPSRPVELELRLNEEIAAGVEPLIVRHQPNTEQFVPYLATVTAGRSSIVATVDHFSWYDGVLFGINDVLSERSDPPDCGRDAASGKGVPAWVRDTTFLDDREAPATYCVGHDPKKPALLVVKVAANRPYGFAVLPAVKPVWTYNTQFQSAGPEDLVKRTLQELSGASLPAALQNGFFLTPGAQVHLAFDEASVRPSKNPLIRLANDPYPALVGLLYGLSIDALGDDDNSVQVRAVAATMVIVGLLQCGYDVFTGSLTGAFAAVARCGADNWQLVATTVPKLAVAAFPMLERARLKAICEKVARKLMWLAVARHGYQAAEYAADTRLLPIAYQVNVFSTLPKRALDPSCKENLSSAAVCRFVAAALGGDRAVLTADERTLLGSVTDLPRGKPWRVDECYLEGDVTARCLVSFGSAASFVQAEFYLGPANGEYDGDGGITTAPGEDLFYEVGSYEGLVRSGPFAAQWYGHTRSLTITADGTATESIGDGCCRPIIDLTWTLSNVRLGLEVQTATGRVTSVDVHDPSVTWPAGRAPRVGDVFTVSLKNGVLSQHLVDTIYCDEEAGRDGTCGA